ncbi:hypothetical protein HDU91_007168 [Kappamyces sp. JEL0680]|nr:hypothetical protein HDU91_007168 [Kappamyces sp. JEL0680]
MSYGLLACLPPEYGLYATVVSAIAHLLFGISPYQSVGPFAVVSLMTGNALLSTAMKITPVLNVTLEIEDAFVPYEAFPLIFPLNEFLTLLVGLLLLAILLTGFGKYCEKILSPSLVSGFTGAAGLSIATSQAKYFLGVKTEPITGSFFILRTLWALLTHLDPFPFPSMAIGVGTIVLIVAFEMLETQLNVWLNTPRTAHFMILTESPTEEPSPPSQKINFPKILLALTIMTMISFNLELPEKYGTSIVGDVPTGLPLFGAPFQIFGKVHGPELLTMLLSLVPNALSIALVIYVTLLSIMQSFPVSVPGKIALQSPIIAPVVADPPAVRTTPVPQTEDNVEVDVSSVASPSSLDLPVGRAPLIALRFASTVARESEYCKPEDNELFALAMANILCSFSSGFVSCSSLSRSALLATQTPVVSPLGNAIASVFVVITVQLLSKVIYHIPTPCLAAIVIISLKGIILKIGHVAELWRKVHNSRSLRSWEEFSTWVVTFLAVFLLEPSSGIIIGIMFSVMWLLAKRIRF